MLLWIISLLTLAAAAADVIHYRRMRRRAPGVRHRVFIVAAAATDALPAVIAVAGVVARDNTTAFMTFAMWAFWAWMVTVLPRMACYFFRWIGLPRVGIAAGAGVAALFVWGATAGRTTIRVNRTEVCSERLPAGLDGFRIAQITDTHLGTVVRPEAELRRLVDSVNSLRPDLIVFCGDLVNIRSSELDARARQLLGGLRAPYGVVSVTGNHDAGLYIKDTVAQSPAASLAEVIARQRAMGWNVLEDTTIYLRRGGDSISLTGLSFDPARSDKVVLQFTIKRQYRIPTDSEAKIFSNGLMGAKAIEITYGTADTYLQKGDTLRSSRDRDLMDMAGSELDFFKQKVSQLTTDLSRTLENLNGLMETNADNIAGTLGNLNSVTGDMAEILSAEKNSLKSALDNLSKFSDMLGENAGRVDSIIGDVDRFTSQLTEEQFARKLSQAVEHLDGLVARIAQGEGTVGKLISAPELYDSLEKASDNLAALLADVKQYPGRYVHLSLFGRNPEKMKERADRKAAKVAAKAERDSLRRLQ